MSAWRSRFHDKELQWAYRFKSTPRNDDVVMSVPTYRDSDVAVRTTNASGDDSAKKSSTKKFCAFVILLFLLVSVTISFIMVTVILTQKSSDAVQIPARVKTWRVQSSLRVTNKTYTTELADHASPEFKAAATEFRNQLKETLLLDGSPLKGMNFSCNVLEIRNGSFIFIYELVIYEPRSGTILGAEFNDLLARFIIAQAKDGKVGTLSVDSTWRCGVSTWSSRDVTADACPPIPSDWTPGQDCYIPATKEVRQNGAVVEARPFYNGTVDVTLSGRKCQMWAAQDPHFHRTVGNIPCHFGTGETMEEVANYCRIVLADPLDEPWCFTTDPDQRLETCNVTKCM